MSTNIDSDVVRTREEIVNILAIGKAWSDKYPRSRFGDDNRAAYENKKAILTRVLDGEPLGILREDADAMDGEERYEAYGIIDWLSGDSEDAPYSSEDE